VTEGRAALRLLPNQLTAVRLALIPVLWVLAFLDQAPLVGVVLAVAAFTDVLDGFIARRTRTVTRFGGAMDSIADHLLSTSAVFFMFMLEPEFTRERWLPLLTWAALGVATLAYGWARHRRIANVHLWSAKLGNVVAYAFLTVLFLFPGYSFAFFVVSIGMIYLGAVETLLVLSRDRPDAYRGTILLPPRR
jgi:cardiolipin synthase